MCKMPRKEVGQGKEECGMKKEPKFLEYKVHGDGKLKISQDPNWRTGNALGFSLTSTYNGELRLSGVISKKDAESLALHILKEINYEKKSNVVDANISDQLEDKLRRIPTMGASGEIIPRQVPDLRHYSTDDPESRGDDLNFGFNKK